MIEKIYTNGAKSLSTYCSETVGSQPWSPAGYYVGIDGVTYRGVAWDSYSASTGPSGNARVQEIVEEVNPFGKLKFYPSSDTKNDFNSAQTALTNIVGTYSQSFSPDYSSLSANFTISVTSATDIDVNSVQITKSGRRSNGSAWVLNVEVLICSIYFDTPIHISAGETKAFTITRTMI